MDIRKKKLTISISIRLTSSLLLILLLFFFLSFSLLSCHGEPVAEIIIHNQTNQTLYITYYGKEKEVKPGTKITLVYNYFSDYEYPIRLKNNSGDVVFDKAYSYQELKDMDFKVIVLPLENIPEDSGNNINK